MMQWSTLINRTASLAIAASLLALFFFVDSSPGKSPSCVLGVVFSLCLIWFGDAIGSFTGYIGRGGDINTESPGWLVAAFGWFFLIGIPLLLSLSIALWPEVRCLTSH